MTKKLLLIAFFSFFCTTTVFASPSVSIEIDNKKASISINGVEENVSSLQLDFIDEKGNSNASFEPSKSFKYSNLIESKNGGKTNFSILIDDNSNIFQSGSLNLGVVSFKEVPNISKNVELELFDINQGLIGKELSLEASITIKNNNNNNNNNNSGGSGSGSGSSGGSGSGSSSGGGSGSGAIIGSTPLPKEEDKVEEKPTTENKINVDEMYPVIKTVAFNDISGHWANQSIVYLAERGIINGISDEKFLPNNNITRAEFVTLLAKMDKIDENKFKSEGLKDVPSNSWFSPYVDWAVKNGITKGIDNENFAPNDTITREQMAVMIKRFSDYKGFSLNATNTKKYFADENTISSYAKDAIEIVQQAGIINGREDGSFAPKDKATRGETAKMLHNLIIIQ